MASQQQRQPHHHQHIPLIPPPDYAVNPTPEELRLERTRSATQRLHAAEIDATYFIHDGEVVTGPNGRHQSGAAVAAADLGDEEDEEEEDGGDSSDHHHYNHYGTGDSEAMPPPYSPTASPEVAAEVAGHSADRKATPGSREHDGDPSSSSSAAESSSAAAASAAAVRRRWISEPSSTAYSAAILSSSSSAAAPASTSAASSSSSPSPLPPPPFESSPWSSSSIFSRTPRRHFQEWRRGKEAKKKVDFYENLYGFVPKNVMSEAEWRAAREAAPKTRAKGQLKGKSGPALDERASGSQREEDVADGAFSGLVLVATRKKGTEDNLSGR
ncbi:hypothetical protein Micbo1qcDRAFT_177787 [Microdochium bolleyi]|uniref:Uncharacterized protein n=1 Tax=Microdochium bolleyi TaxID=196109 RepID=A0A136IVA4_9PEZI|nr:hypothetical protein Micbo1qcDRAFT_177787 [Microdochium bolleyi]